MIKEVTFAKTKMKSPIVFVGRPTTRSASFKKSRTHDSFEEAEEEKLQER